MSRRRKPDIVFTEPVKHHQSPRQRLYNSRRRKNVKRGFGTAALTCGILALLMFVFPLVDLPIGILGVIFAFVAYGIRTDGRDVGHHLATAGLWASLVSLVLTGIFWFMSETNRGNQNRATQEEANRLVESITGIWKSNTDNDISIEFTPAGNLIFATLDSEVEHADPLQETAGLFQVTTTEMVIAFGAQSTNFTWEILPNGQLIIMAPSNRNIALPLQGKWRKIKTLKMGIDYDSASEELRDYFHQLDDYTERKKVLIKTLVDYRTEKGQYVKQLNQYENQKKTRDDRWRVIGRQLKSVNQHIETIQERIATIDRVIVRLQGVIRNEGRQEDIQRLGMTESELIQLLATSRELEEKLKLAPEVELLDDDEVVKMLNEASESNETDDVQPVGQNE